MANLAIKGHPTRGKEVIEILEMLGGKNSFYYNGTFKDLIYTIGSELELDVLNIYSPGVKNDYIVFTLEEFLEKFPYKVGDKVWLHYTNSTIRITETITCMRWCDKWNYVLYDVSTCCNLRESTFTPYKEETMEENEIIKPVTEINLNHPCFDGHNEIELIIPTGWGFEQRGNKMFGVRKQYPKTYEECCKIIGAESNRHYQYTKKDKEIDYPHEVKLLDCLDNLRKLLICRDAYWKIAGDQMGLGEPWGPDTCQIVYSIGRDSNRISLCNDMFGGYFILEFPTEEIRDTFYENFKNLIEICKELL